MEKFSIITLFLLIVACNHKPNSEAVKLVNEANKIGLLYGKNDKALELINKAIEIDDEYFNAYNSKTTFLTAKKDIDGLLLNNQKMIELRPNQPLWIIQRGLFFDIKDDKNKAQENYALGISKYREILKQKDMYQDFNFRIEYISAFEAQGNLSQAKIEMEKLKNDFPKNEIVQSYLKDYKLKSKVELISLWQNGK